SDVCSSELHDITPGNAGGAYRQTDVDLSASNEGGNCIGWISAGEWVNYSVNVSTAGRYLIEARVASYGQGGTFHVEFDGKDATGPLAVPNTGGWQNWATVSTRVTLANGPQRMRVVFDTAGPSSAVGNLSWIRLSKAAS